jgi:MoxR-like ATPase
MITIKAGRPLIDLVKLCHAADVPLMIEGRHGVGKSALLERAADELGIDFICRDLSLMEPADLLGLPVLDGAVMRYAVPSFLPTGGKGLIVFEEVNRCPCYMRAPCLQLLTARTLNDYQLPRGWVPCAAVNPADDRYEVADLDPALLSRFVRATVVPDREEWLGWARDGGIHSDVIAYVEGDPSIFAVPEGDLGSTTGVDAPTSNPRAWTYVSRLLEAAARTGASREILRVAISGLVGAARAGAFLKTLRDDARALSANMALDYTRWRAKFQGWIDAGRLDLVNASLLNLMKHLQVRRNFDAVRADHSRWKNLGMFLAGLPGDLREDAEKFFEERGYDKPAVRRRA